MCHRNFTQPTLTVPALFMAALLAGCAGKNDATAHDAAVPAGRAVAAEESSELPGLKGTLVFISDRSGAAKVWTLQFGARRLKQITHDEFPDAWPRFSPDGSQILYTSFRAAGAEVWRVNRDGSGPARVTHGKQANWSPDGQHIAFLRDKTVCIRALGSGEEREFPLGGLMPAAPPVWNPDGKSLVLSSIEGPEQALVVFDFAEKTFTPLGVDQSCLALRWSIGGRKLLCQSAQGHIVQIDRDGQNSEQLTDGADLQEYACYSPDGGRLIFCRAPEPDGPWEICVKDLANDDGSFVQLTHHGSNFQVDWNRSD